MQQSRGSPAAAMEDGGAEAQPRRSRGPAWSWRGRREEPGGLERGRDREGDSGEEGGRACEGEMGSGTRVRSREEGGRARVSWRRRESDGIVGGSARVREPGWAWRTREAGGWASRNKRAGLISWMGYSLSLSLLQTLPKTE